MKIYVENKNVTAFLTFGFTDRYSAIAAGHPEFGYAHLFDKDFKPKPAYYAVLDILKSD